MNYKNIFTTVLVSLIILTPLYSQNLFFQEFQVPFVYDSKPLFVQNTTQESDTTTDTSYEVGTILKSFVDPRSDGFSGFLWGSCTEYIARQRPELFVNQDGSRRMSGNAEDWLRNAQRLWLETSSKPQVGAIAVYKEWKWAREYGHVAYVEEIQDDGTLIVSEMNYEEDYIVTWRVVDSKLALWYIY